MDGQSSWDDYAGSWDDDEAVRLYSDRAFESLTEHVLPALTHGTGRVLDFGCGTGLLTTKLSERFSHVIGVDTSVKMIETLDSKLRDLSITNVVTVVGDIEDPAFTHPELGNGSFDLVVASSVCSFLTSFEQATQRLASLLGPDGVFVQWDWLAASDDDFGLTPDRIRASYDAAGLNASRVEPTFALEDKSGSQMHVVMGIGRQNEHPGT